MAKCRKTDHRIELFVKEYMTDLNAKQAAIRAGYSSAGAEVRGSLLLSNSKARPLLDKAFAEASKRCDVSADRILREFCRMAFYDSADYYDENGDLKPLHTLTEDQRACIVGVKDSIDKEGTLRREYKLADKARAAENLAKHFGLPPESMREVGQHLGREHLVVDEETTAATLEEMEKAGVITRHRSITAPVTAKPFVKTGNGNGQT